MGVNGILFGSIIIQAVLMPFKKRIHNWMEIASLSLNFILFDIAISADKDPELVGWTLDIVRVTVLFGFLGFGLIENSTMLSGMAGRMAAAAANAAIRRCCCCYCPFSKQRRNTTVMASDEDILIDGDGNAQGVISSAGAADDDDDSLPDHVASGSLAINTQ